MPTFSKKNYKISKKYSPKFPTNFEKIFKNNQKNYKNMQKIALTSPNSMLPLWLRCTACCSCVILLHSYLQICIYVFGYTYISSLPSQFLHPIPSTPALFRPIALFTPPPSNAPIYYSLPHRPQYPAGIAPRIAAVAYSRTRLTRSMLGCGLQTGVHHSAPNRPLHRCSILCPSCWTPYGLCTRRVRPASSSFSASPFGTHLPLFSRFFSMSAPHVPGVDFLGSPVLVATPRPTRSLSRPRVR